MLRSFKISSVLSSKFNLVIVQFNRRFSMRTMALIAESVPPRPLLSYKGAQLRYLMLETTAEPSSGKMRPLNLRLILLGPHLHLEKKRTRTRLLSNSNMQHLTNLFYKLLV